MNTLYTAENITQTPFNAEQFNLLDELEDAVNETWDSLKETFSLSVLSNPIEASKGDGDMDSSTMGAMAARFGSSLSAYKLSNLCSTLCALHFCIRSHCP